MQLYACLITVVYENKDLIIKQNPTACMATCLVFVFIDSSEARNKNHVEYYLSNMQTITEHIFKAPVVVPLDLREAIQCYNDYLMASLTIMA